jgi:hypothetical protein
MNKTTKLSLILVILISILATPLFLNNSLVVQSEIKPRFHQKAVRSYPNGTVIEKEWEGELQFLGYSADGVECWGPNPDTIKILHYKVTASGAGALAPTTVWGME